MLLHALRSFAAAVLATAALSCAEGTATVATPRERGTDRETGGMKIRIDVNGRAITATLNDSDAARDFSSLLPVSVELEDYASTEKVASLPRRLSTTGAPAGSDPEAGDIAYYAPWGNLAMYYRGFGYSAGLVKLGRIDGDVEALRVAEGRATIVRVVP